MRALLAGALGGAAAIALLAPATGDALGRLALARAERAARAAAPRETLPPGAAIRAADGAAAGAMLVATLRREAARRGVLIEQIAATDGATGSVRVKLRVSGSADGAVAFADAVERGRPLTRFAGWRIDGIGGGAVRLSGEAVAPWR